MTVTTTISIDEDDLKLITEYAKSKGTTATAFLCNSALERIEDELDLQDLNEAIEEYQREPVSYSFDEVERKLDENETV